MNVQWKDFFKRFAKYTDMFDFFILETDSNNFYYFTKQEFLEYRIPDTIKDNLYRDDVAVSFFKKDSKVFIFYFLRVTIDDTKLVIVFQDDNKRNRVTAFLQGLLEFSSLNLTELNQLEKEIEFLREELEECEKEVTVLDDKRLSYEEEINSKNIEIESLSESVSVLKNSRQKMLKLIDGLNNPLFSIDLEYELVNINRAVGEFVGNSNLPQFIGSKCYKMIYNFEDICSWCPLNKVIAEKQSYNQHIEVNMNGEEYVFEQVMYPIFDSEGNVIEAGEFLNDITEQYHLVKSLEKSQQKIKKISKDRVNSLNEVSSLKKAYDELYQEYEKSQARIKKLNKTLEKILEQDSTKDFLRLKNENKELKIKIDKLNKIVNNYKRLMEKDSTRMEDLAKRSVFAIERMTNIISNRKKIEDKDLKNIFNFINGQIDSLKNMLNKKEEENGSESSD